MSTNPATAPEPSAKPTSRKFLYLGIAGIVVLVVVVAALMTGGAGNSVAALKKAAMAIEKEEDRLNVQSALIEFEKAEDLQPYFAGSYACAVFPTIGKGGIGIGGAYGTGWLFRSGKLTGISKMTQVTIGFQMGGQAFSQIIFFENEAAYIGFTSGNFEFGAQASAVAITVGANASASTAGGTGAGAGTAQTKDNYSDGMAVFTLAKGGLMYEASVGGQKFSFKDL